MGSQQQFCLRWNNHQSNIIGVFEHLLQSESLVDVTLACDGLSLKAHKVVLSACSPYFQHIFLDNPCKHPVVILKDVKFSDLRALIDFMYRGEVNVSQDQLSALLATAETLKVKGLAEVTSGMNNTSDGGDGGGGGNNSGNNENLTSSTGSAVGSAPPPMVAGNEDAGASDIRRQGGSPPAKRKRIRIRRRSGGGGSNTASDVDEELQEVIAAPPAPLPIEILEAKVEVTDNDYPPCSQASGRSSGGTMCDGRSNEMGSNHPPISPIDHLPAELSPQPSIPEPILGFPSGTGLEVITSGVAAVTAAAAAAAASKQSGNGVTLMPSNLQRLAAINPIAAASSLSSLSSSASLPPLQQGGSLPPPNAAPMPSTSGTQPTTSSGQGGVVGSPAFTPLRPRLPPKTDLSVVVRAVIEHNLSFREAGRMFGVSHMTVYNHVKNAMRAAGDGKAALAMQNMGDMSHNKQLSKSNRSIANDNSHVVRRIQNVNSHQRMRNLTSNPLIRPNENLRVANPMSNEGVQLVTRAQSCCSSSSSSTNEILIQTVKTSLDHNCQLTLNDDFQSNDNEQSPTNDLFQQIANRSADENVSFSGEQE